MYWLKIGGDSLTFWIFSASTGLSVWRHKYIQHIWKKDHIATWSVSSPFIVGIYQIFPFQEQNESTWVESIGTKGRANSAFALTLNEKDTDLKVLVLWFKYQSILLKFSHDSPIFISLVIWFLFRHMKSQNCVYREKS